MPKLLFHFVWISFGYLSIKNILHKSTCVKEHVKFSAHGVILKSLGPRARGMRFWTLSFLRCVTVKCFNVSQPVSHVWVGGMTSAPDKIVLNIKWDNTFEVLCFLLGTYKIQQFIIKFLSLSTLLVAFPFHK